MNGVLIGLIDRIRMLDNDLIRLRSKLNTVLTIRENQKRKNQSNIFINISMKTLLKKMVLVVFFIPFLNISILASELDFEFKNPAFSGDGYSSHVLSVDQLQEQRKNK